MNRRGFLLGMIALCSSSAIVKAGNIMPVVVHSMPEKETLEMLLLRRIKQAELALIANLTEDLYSNDLYSERHRCNNLLHTIPCGEYSCPIDNYPPMCHNGDAQWRLAP